MRWEYWRHNVLFSWQWLFLVGAAVGLTFIWARLVRWESAKIQLLYGLLIFLFSTIADTIGGELQLWDYPKMFLPWGPRAVEIDWMISIFSMLAFQYAPRWRSFIPVTIGMATLFAFVFEPLAKWMQIYREIAWSPLYSFPIYIAMCCGFKLAAEGFASWAKKRSSAQPRQPA
ncbi:CBO0543 family protein [Paenibacillus chartarius]|uniref:CBO0543 family protein n=1 Tax=Paenibacillus chartarius TaxID=747481 RepID=A0ABV6DS52_9BACL